MAVIAEVTLRGVNKEQYDALRERVGWLAHLPEGGLAHLTWWDGQDCRNVDSWESEAAFAAFGEQRLGPALAALGLDVEPEVIFHPAHEVFTPRRGVVADTALPDDVTDNVELVRRAYAAFAAGDIPGVLDVLDPQVIWTTPDSVRFGGSYTGPQQVAQFFSALPENFAELTVAPETFVDGGDTVVVIGTHGGRTQAGTAFQSPFVHVWTWQAGKAISFSEIFDTAPLLPDLGHSPATASIPAGSAAR